jgi:hypothetical protein
MRRVLVLFSTLLPLVNQIEDGEFQRSRPKKVRAVVKCPTCPTGVVEEGIYIFIMSIMRDSGDAVTMTPRCGGTQPPPAGRKEGRCSIPRGRKKPTVDRRMKRDLNELHDLSLLRVWFSGGHCRYLGLGQPVDLEKETTAQLSLRGGASDQLTYKSPGGAAQRGPYRLDCAGQFPEKTRRTWGVEGWCCCDCDMPKRLTGVLTTYGGATTAEQGRAPWLF